MSWFRRKDRDKIDPEQYIRKAEESLRQTRRRQSHVDYLSDTLGNRLVQNGFGEDFEYTLRPKDLPGRA